MNRAAILETSRLLLREMTEADAEHLLALGRNPNVMRYIPGEPPVTSLDDALVVLRERVFPQYAHGIGRWACIEKTSGAFIGWCGVKYIAEDDEYDVGYRFFEEHWGNGYATESASAVCELARRHLVGKRVVGKALRDNAASRRVLEKIGLVYEGEVETEFGPTSVYVLVA
jgi:RimJ/RimL family protein N-acetyltransferase